MKTVLLTSCGSFKQNKASKAKEMYTSGWARHLTAYCERVINDECKWFIMSSEHHLLEPERIIEPYEGLLIPTMPRAWRWNWSYLVYQDLVKHLEPNTHVIIFAGTKYRNFLIKWLERDGHTTSVPFDGVSIGVQTRILMSINSKGIAEHIELTAEQTNSVQELLQLCQE